MPFILVVERVREEGQAIVFQAVAQVNRTPQNTFLLVPHSFRFLILSPLPPMAYLLLRMSGS
jgi:hypothetical protein